MPFVKIFLPISCAYGLLATVFTTSPIPFPPCLCLHHAVLLAALALGLAGLITMPGVLAAAADFALGLLPTAGFLPGTDLPLYVLRIVTVSGKRFLCTLSYLAKNVLPFGKVIFKGIALLTSTILFLTIFFSFSSFFYLPKVF